MSVPDAHALCEKLAASAKYRHLSSDTLLSAARWARVRSTSEADALKVAKRKLHQICGAFLSPNSMKKVDALVRDDEAYATPESVEAMSRAVLEQHASTAERKAIVDGAFAQVLAGLGIVRRIVDIGCGLNPFATPFMKLDPATEYVGYDIDRRLIEAAQEYLRRLGRPHAMECRDALVRPPTGDADVLMLLKVATTFEQQEAGSTLRVIGSATFRHLVVSFPTRSLGGHGKGMREHYDEFAGKLAASLGVQPRVFSFDSEVFYRFSPGGA